MPKGKAKKKEVIASIPTAEQLDLMKDLNIPEDDATRAAKNLIQESSDYFEVLEEGEGAEGIGQADYKDVILALWEQGKNVPKEKWVKIRLKKAVCDPTVALRQFKELMEKAYSPEYKDNPRKLATVDNWKKMNATIWKEGTVLKLPPEVAAWYVSQKYFLGYEGFGEFNRTKMAFPGMEKIGQPIFGETAEYVKE